MHLDDDLYVYIHRVADQIEGLTCALIIFIENVGSQLESYHYEAFNKFSNKIREMEISVSKEIMEEFIDVKDGIEESAVRIRASENSINRLRSQLEEIENVFFRLVIHSENIREFNSDTSNPYVPNATEEVYSAFSGYDRLLGQFQVGKPDENDPICTLMYSFFCTVSSLFEKLFREYDSLLRDFGGDVEEKRRNLEALTVIKKREGSIAKSALEVAKTTAYAALHIKKKKISDIAESVVGLVAAINNTLQDLDKLNYVNPKKSLARKIIKGIATYYEATELVGKVIGVEGSGAKLVGADFEVPTLTKLMLAVPLAAGKGKSLEKWKESGALGVTTSALGMVESFINIGVSLTSGNVKNALKGIPDLGSKALGLVEITAKYLHKNKIHVKPKAVDKKLHKLGSELKKYNDDVEKYMIAKERKQTAAKISKAPPFIGVKEVLDKLRIEL
ncbi:MAG: hypothetical protein Q4D76_17485 [Oscillospiraceae bacterium]|nr:hypothetical protein [Oscillospiraceae bacterium]